jgi:hypothetical protein
MPPPSRPSSNKPNYWAELPLASSVGGIHPRGSVLGNDEDPVPTSTVPDFFPAVKHLPRVAVAPGAPLELVALSVRDTHCAGIDLASGALLRVWSPEASSHQIQPYDVVRVTLDDDFDEVPDPHQPEALVVARAPEPVRRLPGRRVERMLRRLLHPPGEPLLGEPSSVVAFWERRRDRPSIAVVEPRGPITLWRQGGYLACRFEWLGHERELPCLDTSIARIMDRSHRSRPLMADKGDRLLVALTPPIEGRCHKVVETILPRP